MAAQNGHTEVVRLLLDKGASIDAATQVQKACAYLPDYSNPPSTTIPRTATNSVANAVHPAPTQRASRTRGAEAVRAFISPHPATRSHASRSRQPRTGRMHPYCGLCRRSLDLPGLRRMVSQAS